MSIKHLIQLSLLSYVLLMASCDSMETYTELYLPSTEQHVLWLNRKSFSFESLGGEQSLEVRSEHTPWNIKNHDSWFDVTPDKGDASATLSVIATPNKGDARISSFQIQPQVLGYTDIPASVAVSQAAAYPFIEGLPQDGFMLDNAKASSLSVLLHTNVKAQDITFSYNTIDWITCSVEQTGEEEVLLSLAVAENTTDHVRKGTILLNASLYGKSISTSIVVSQAFSEVTVDTNNIFIGCIGGQASVNIYSPDVDWSADCLREDSVWLQLDYETANAGYNKKLTLKALPNVSTESRDAYVYVKTGAITRLILHVVQENVHLEIESSQRHIDFHYSGEVVGSGKAEQVVNVACNYAWSYRVSEDDSWISVARENNELQIRAQENYGDNSRDAIITVFVPELPQLSIDLIVSQESPIFNLLAPVVSEQNISSHGGRVHVSLQGNERWNAFVGISGRSWIQLTRNEGEGPKDEFDIDVAENASVHARHDTVSIIPTVTAPLHIVINQAGRYLYIDRKDVFVYPVSGQIGPIKVTTDAPFQITQRGEDTSWFSFKYDDEVHALFLSVQENKGARREGELVFTLTGLQDNENYEVVLPILQLAPGGNFDIIDYADDEEWTFETETQGSFTLKGYEGNEEDWNSANDLNGEGIHVEHYDDTEENWNF